MNKFCLNTNSFAKTVIIQSEASVVEPIIQDSNGNKVPTMVLRREVDGVGGIRVELDAAHLCPWTPNNPVLYHLVSGAEVIRFGYVELKSQKDQLLVNGEPFYFRGYIRGITAHDHPNLTGMSKREFFRKNILQAKKYGFNLVRFHSTIPELEFVELADELGLFIHLEVGYNYEFDEKGHKKGFIMDHAKWRETILRYRNHPSVAIFCLGNEMHNAGRIAEVADLVEMGRALAPGKLMMDNAGWGEFDRTSSDIFAQHIAYYFPFKSHQEMFKQDFCWEMNGSAHQVPTVSSKSSAQADISVRRQLNPVRPVMAHECVHYIDIPDYAKLNRKFDAFAKTVGAEALARNGIEKPRYMTDLPALIGLKKLENKMPDYIEASQQFKTMALKTYLEQLRMSPKLCGFEMLQLSDCLKYENNNGIIDCFDDDKFIPAEWMRQFNSDLVLLAEFPKENFRENESFQMSIHLSNFSNALLYDGQLTLSLKVANGFQEILYEGSHFSALSGLSKLLDLQLALKAIGSQACECTLEAVFSSPGGECRNQWKLWVYPAVRLNQCPETRLSQPELKVVVQKLGKDVLINKNLILSDRLDDTLLDMLDAGKTVILNYHRDLQNQYYLPGTLDRFKPCIWDRGSNLGGVVTADWLQTALGSGRNFDKNLYHLVEMAYKVNLDHFPCSVNEVVWGVDKPVRDRMKGLIHGTKTFLPDDTLRNFSYLFSVRVGRGLLMVCTFKLEAALTDPAAESVLCAIINSASYLKTDHRLEPAVFKKYLQDCTAAGVIKEDVMNHFWEIDNKPVEDTLFWEQAQVDLRKMGSATNK